jgi:hypothetical protein
MKAQKLDLRFTEVHENIKKMCEGLRSLADSGLKDDLLVLMLMDQTGLNKTQIRTVVNALPKLEKIYLKGGK